MREKFREVFTNRTATIREACVHRGLFYPLEVLVFILLVFFAMFFLLPVFFAYILKPALRLAGIALNTPMGSVLLLLNTLAPFLAILLYAHFIQKRSLSSMGFSLKRVKPVREIFRGMLIGFVMISSVIFLEMAAGFIQFTGINGTEFILPVVVGFFCFVVQSTEEEAVCRGFFMVSIARRYPVWLAILTNSLLFGLLHFANPGVTVLSTLNTCLVGILFSIIFLKRDSIWMASAIHAAWNFTQSCIYGQSTSGNELMPSLFKMTIPTGTDWLSGGSYGVEAGVFTTIILLAAIVGFILSDTQDSFHGLSAKS